MVGNKPPPRGGSGCYHGSGLLPNGSNTANGNCLLPFGSSATMGSMSSQGGGPHGGPRGYPSPFFNVIF